MKRKLTEIWKQSRFRKALIRNEILCAIRNDWKRNKFICSARLFTLPAFLLLVLIHMFHLSIAEFLGKLVDKWIDANERWM